MRVSSLVLQRVSCIGSRNRCSWFVSHTTHILSLSLSLPCCRGWCVSFFFTCTLVVARSQTCPGGQMLCGGEHFHVHSDFRKQFAYSLGIHTGYIAQLLYL